MSKKVKSLVQFGNYLLSEERKERTSEINRNNVTDADLENFKLINKK